MTTGCVQLGPCWSRPSLGCGGGRELGLPFFGCSGGLCGGSRGLADSRAGFPPAEKLSGSEAGARWQPQCAIPTPWKCRPLLALAPKLGLSFPQLPPLCCCLSRWPQESGSRWNCAHRTGIAHLRLPGGGRSVARAQGSRAAAVWWGRQGWGGLWQALCLSPASELCSLPAGSRAQAALTEADQGERLRERMGHT